MPALRRPRFAALTWAWDNIRRAIHTPPLDAELLIREHYENILLCRERRWLVPTRLWTRLTQALKGYR